MASTIDLRDLTYITYSITPSDNDMTLTLRNGETAEVLGNLALSRNLARGMFEHLRIVLEYMNGSFEENYVPEGKFNTTALTGTLTLQPPPETRL